MNAGEKHYIGDGVYVAIERGMIRLTAEDGVSVRDVIYLEPEVWRALKLYVEALEKQAQEQQPA